MNDAKIARVLIVDDEAANMRALCDTLHDQGYDTEGFATGAAALAAMRERPFDLLLTDLMMPGMDGVELLTAALKVDPHIVGILMTGMGTIETAVQAMKAGALDYVLKPIKVSAILPVLARAAGVRRLRMENMELRNTVAIHELNQAIAYTLDPNALLDKIADAALAQFEADEASVMLLSEDGRSLFVAAVRGDQRETLLGARVPVGEGIAGAVAVSREAIVLQGGEQETPPQPLHPRPEIQSALSMPMIARNRLIGVLNINYTHRSRTIPPGQIRVMGIFVNAAAAGIEAARLYENERRLDARYRTVLQMAADAIISLDGERRIVLFNGAAERIYGWSAQEIIGKSIDMLIPDRLQEAHRRHLAAFDASPGTTVPMRGRGPFFGRRKDGTEFPAEISISSQVQGTSTIYTAVLRDITERVEHEAKIARLTRLYAVLSGINSTIVRSTSEADLFHEVCRVTTDEGEMMAAYVIDCTVPGPDISIITGSGKAEMFAAPIVMETGARVSQGLLSRALAERTVVWDNDIAARPDIGTMRRTAVGFGARSAAALPFSVNGELRAVMVLYSDIPNIFEEQEVDLLREMAGDVSFALDHIEKSTRLDYLATHDQLTGLPNRAVFLDRLNQILLVTGAEQKMLAVVIADIERFKHVNDTLGRQAGDELLIQIGDRFHRILGDQTSLARVGADSFAMIYRDCGDAAAFTRVIRERQEAAFAEPFVVQGQSLHLSVRAGVALFPADANDAESLFRNAESALKSAKSQNERSAFYTPDLNARVAEQLLLENKLRHALERNEFVLHYQPKVDLKSGRIVGLEALIRWQDPDGGLVPPARFIPLLEETGLILPVGRWAMQEAVRAVAQLRAPGQPSLRIAVNVSTIQLRQPDFVKSVEEAIAGAGADHGLDLEITENVAMENIAVNVRKLEEVRRMNVGVAIDDFGTGYSSLTYIARLPVDTIKIDRAFILKFNNDADSMAIVQTIISLTHTLRRTVVAEGVESEAQADLLRSLGCDQFQGYLFSKPVPLAEIGKMLPARS